MEDQVNLVITIVASVAVATGVLGHKIRHHLQLKRRRRKQQRFRQLLFQRFGIDRAVECETLKALRPGVTCWVSGTSVALTTTTEPMYGEAVLGYRLAVTFPEDIEEVREIFNVVDVPDFLLRDETGTTLHVVCHQAQILSSSRQKLEVPWTRSPEAIREIVSRQSPEAARYLAQQSLLLWSEWVVNPGERLGVVGRTREVPSVRGGNGMYRTTPTGLALEPASHLGVILMLGSVDDTVSCMLEHPAAASFKPPASSLQSLLLL